MKTLQERIRPSADLRNHYNEISKQCREDGEAVIITVNGRGDTVSLDYEEYKRMKARLELLEILAEAEEDVALDKLEILENQILSLADNPYMGTAPRYMILRRQGYKVLITEKNLAFYKINEKQKVVTVYAVVDQRKDYLSIIRGL